MAEPSDDDQTTQIESESGEPTLDESPETDSAVEDILRKEGDDELKAQDEAAEQAVVMKLSAWERFKNFQADWWGNPRKKWGTICVVFLIAAALFVVPLTRYEMLGVFIREKVTVRVVDSKDGDPVSAAKVSIGSNEANTDGEGRAVLYVHAGSRDVRVTKSYYAGSSQTELVTLSSTHNVFKTKLEALGRQVKIKVVNTIGQKPLADAEVSAGMSHAKTSSTGLATIVLPSGATAQSATVSLSGYNSKNVTIAAAGSLSENTFSVTPAGKVYFLSNMSGTVDVVQTNLDGTDRQTVLTGTVNEEPADTELMVSSDSKYVALLARRSGSIPSLYVIDTTNGDKLITVDSSNDSFSLVGWSGDNFIYEATNASANNWQTGQQMLKSYSPTTDQTLLLDQTQASGTDQDDFLMQNLEQAYIMNGQIVYAKGWQAGASSISQLASKSAELDSINADGSDHKVIQSFSLSEESQSKADVLELTLRTFAPDSLYILFHGDTTDSFYTYVDSQVSTNTTLNDASFSQTVYPTYIYSPSGSSALWSEQQIGSNELFTAEVNGSNQQQIATSGIYSPFGWFTDSYILVQTNDELYIMPATGGTPVPISNYFLQTADDGGYSGGVAGQ